MIVGQNLEVLVIVSSDIDLPRYMQNLLSMILGDYEVKYQPFSVRLGGEWESYYQILMTNSIKKKNQMRHSWWAWQ